MIKNVSAAYTGPAHDPDPSGLAARALRAAKAHAKALELEVQFITELQHQNPHIPFPIRDPAYWVEYPWCLADGTRLHIMLPSLESNDLERGEFVVAHALRAHPLVYAVVEAAGMGPEGEAYLAVLNGYLEDPAIPTLDTMPHSQVPRPPSSP